MESMPTTSWPGCRAFGPSRGSVPSMGTQLSPGAPPDPHVPEGWGGRWAGVQLGGTEMSLWDRARHVPAWCLIPAVCGSIGPHGAPSSPPPLPGWLQPFLGAGSSIPTAKTPCHPLCHASTACPGPAGRGTWAGGTPGGAGTPATVRHPDPLLFLLLTSGASGAVFAVRGPERTGRMGSSWRGELG